ncbi:MAG: DNA polymerase IV [Promethearchaeota archaeon]|jgi:DNA polymerase IV (DinB-like DNA polymerase)
MNRLILHCDLDCFFAAVEIRDNPQYIGKPVVIGADPKEGKGRGVVSTCSYEARKFGIHSGMPISQAYRRCPHGIYLRPSFKKYTSVSKQVMQILCNYSEDFQQIGSDEAYLDVTDKCLNFAEALKTARLIQQEISKNLGISISIGIAPTKSLAKIASDYNKPNGVTVFKPDNFKELLKNMDITSIPGIGKKTKVYFYKKGIKTIGDIHKTSLSKMVNLFGEHGKWVWKVANGYDNRLVKQFHGERKSISAERTFFEDTNDFSSILSKLKDINEKIHKSVMKHHITYKTISLKIRFEGYQTYTRAKTLPYHIQDQDKVIKVILGLFKEFSSNKKKVRLVGIKLSNLERNYKARQTNLLHYTYAS